MAFQAFGNSPAKLPMACKTFRNALYKTTIAFKEFGRSSAKLRIAYKTFRNITA
jgi:hypothetical protein